MRCPLDCVVLSLLERLALAAGVTNVNADMPTLHCWVRLPYIADSSGCEEAYAFAIQSMKGRALGFHVMLKSGAHYRNVPIHAIATEPKAAERPLGDCQLWDCFSNTPLVHVYDYLRDHQCICHTRSGPANGTYLFTVDWLPDSAERPGFVLIPDQNKCAHVIALDDGNLCALPTNRIAWKDSYFIGNNPAPQNAGYRVQADVYQAEDSSWDVSGESGYMYRAATESRRGRPAGPGSTAYAQHHPV